MTLSIFIITLMTIASLFITKLPKAIKITFYKFLNNTNWKTLSKYWLATFIAGLFAGPYVLLIQQPNNPTIAVGLSIWMLAGAIVGRLTYKVVSIIKTKIFINKMIKMLNE